MINQAPGRINWAAVVDRVLAACEQEDVRRKKKDVPPRAVPITKGKAGKSQKRWAGPYSEDGEQ